jgi:large subunit ribosomal protein L4
MKSAALRGALSDRARNGNVHVLSAIVEGQTPNTKSALAAINSVSTAKNILVVVDRTDLVSWMSLRNVDAIHLVAVDQLNTYDVLVSDDVVFTKAAIEALSNGPARGKSAKAVASSAEVDA